MIRLADIWPIASPEDYKLHLARWNGENQPLEVWTRDKQDWQGWQEYRPERDDFNRAFIFSLVQFYHETDIWLFGGVFRVVARHPDRYEVELTKEGEGFVGRLKLRSGYRERATRVKFENHYPDLVVQEILREPYSGRSFPGFEDIDLSFEELETLVRNSRPDWQAALSSIKGIYLISDISTGKRYIGSAYGDQGIAAWLSRPDRDGSLVEFLMPNLSPPERTLARVEGWILGVPGLLWVDDLGREGLPSHALH